jgi:hypothetical protein
MRGLAVMGPSSCCGAAVWTANVDSAKQPYGSKNHPGFSNS